MSGWQKVREGAKDLRRRVWYFTELNLQICKYAQKRQICRNNSKHELDFCSHQQAANFCHPAKCSNRSMAFEQC